MSNTPSSSKGETTEADNNQARGQITDPAWKSPIIRRENGDPIGVSIFLAAEDLIDLDVDVERCEKIEYQIIESNRIRIRNPSEDSDEG